MLPFRPPGGHSLHRGSGFGALFSRLGHLVKPLIKTAIRSSRPIAKKMVKGLAKEGATMASSTLSDVISGTPVRSALKRNASASLNRVGKKMRVGAQNALGNLVSNSRAKNKKRYKRKKFQVGSGKRKRSRRRKTIISRKKRTIRKRRKARIQRRGRQRGRKIRRKVGRRKKKSSSQRKPYRGIFA